MFYRGKRLHRKSPAKTELKQNENILSASEARKPLEAPVVKTERNITSGVLAEYVRKLVRFDLFIQGVSKKRGICL